MAVHKKSSAKKSTTVSKTEIITEQLEKQGEMLEEIKELIETKPTIEPTTAVSTEEVKSDAVDLTPDTQNQETESTLDSSPESEDNKSIKNKLLTGNKRFIFILIIIVVGTACVFGYFLFLRQSKIDEMKKQQSITPTTAPSETPSPTKAGVDVSKYTIQVLNGSGIAGEAGKVKGLLTEKEFKVEDIGNAEDASYTKTIIKAKKAVPSEFIDALTKVLQKTYAIDSSNVTLKDSSTTDMVVIVGRQKSE